MVCVASLRGVPLFKCGCLRWRPSLSAFFDPPISPPTPLSSARSDGLCRAIRDASYAWTIFFALSTSLETKLLLYLPIRLVALQKINLMNKLLVHVTRKPLGSILNGEGFQMDLTSRHDLLNLFDISRFAFLSKSMQLNSNL